jgi:hypothetical protein
VFETLNPQINKNRLIALHKYIGGGGNMGRVGGVNGV